MSALILVGPFSLSQTLL